MQATMLIHSWGVAILLLARGVQPLQAVNRDGVVSFIFSSPEAMDAIDSFSRHKAELQRFADTARPVGVAR